MRCPDHQSGGFSLVELLVVIAVVAVLLGLTVSGVVLLSGSAPSQRKNDLAQLLEQARIHAMARQTHVWIGFLEISSPEPQVRVILLASADGTRDVLETTNLYPAITPKSLKRVSLSRAQPPAEENMPVSSVVRSGEGTSINLDGVAWSNLILISPQGFVSLPPSAPGPQIAIGLDASVGSPRTEWLRILPASGKVIYAED